MIIIDSSIMYMDCAEMMRLLVFELDILGYPLPLTQPQVMKFGIMKLLSLERALKTE